MSMEAKDLMIGDWVQHYNGTPMQVTKITTEHFACAENGGVNCWEYNNKFEPIPLTPEILEKNADFHRDEMYYKYYDFSKEIDCYGNSISVEICESKGTVYWTINGNEYGITELKYVHELQHALKLCGIDKEIVV